MREFEHWLVDFKYDYWWVGVVAIIALYAAALTTDSIQKLLRKRRSKYARSHKNR
jgi:hypothetical protein